MMPRDLPPDWDWVTARSQCSIEAYFERLHSGANKNVQTRKEMRIELQDVGPVDLSQRVPGIFSVMRGLGLGAYAAVRFRLDGDRIVVEGQGVDVKFEGRLTLTDAGECRLMVGAQELDEWQVLRRALEPLFFGF